MVELRQCSLEMDVVRRALAEVADRRWIAFGSGRCVLDWRGSGYDLRVCGRTWVGWGGQSLRGCGGRRTAAESAEKPERWGPSSGWASQVADLPGVWVSEGRSVRLSSDCRIRVRTSVQGEMSTRPSAVAS